MKILFLDQSGHLGGAELCLIDIAMSWRDSCCIVLFANGPFESLLKQKNISVKVITTNISKIRKESNIFQGISSLAQLFPLILRISKISQNYDLTYANTQKAMVIGALASIISRRPFIYHLHDILSLEHFSEINIQLAIFLSNRFASLVIANSKATQSAFIAAGGNPKLVHVVHNGFSAENYLGADRNRSQIRQELGIENLFVVGQFSRLSPWKGQHILIDALVNCPENIVVLLVGDALFGEQSYIKQLHQQIASLGLEHRIQFLGFRSDVPALMSACDLIAHTSTAAEPFGRVIVEAMLCKKPVVVADAGGAVELVQHDETGWLCPPGDSQKLAEAIIFCSQNSKYTSKIVQQAYDKVTRELDVDNINSQIKELIELVSATS